MKIPKITVFLLPDIYVNVTQDITSMPNCSHLTRTNLVSNNNAFEIKPNTSVQIRHAFVEN